jgi:hypothetical protein
LFYIYFFDESDDLMQPRKVLSTIALLVACFTLKAGTYYVSNLGNDANPGTLASPWQSIQFAVDNVLAGDTIAVMGGTYFERVVFSASGSAGSPIVLTNISGENVIIDGTGTSAVLTDALIQIFDQSYIVINGLTVTNNIGPDAQGILVEGNCQGIVISNCEVSYINFTSDGTAIATETDNAQPIIVYGSDEMNAITGLVISGNRVHDCNPGYSEGVAVNGNVDGFEITNNDLLNITNIGIDVIGGEGTAATNDQARNGVVKDNHVQNCKSPYATAAGIYLDGASNVIVENNMVIACQWGIEVGCENGNVVASGNVVKNNFIYNNDDAAIAVGGYDYPDNSGKVTFTTIRNNTCLSNDVNPGGLGGETGQIAITYVENTDIFNNIFYKTNGSSLMLSASSPGNGTVDLKLHHNLYFATGDVGARFEYFVTDYDSLRALQVGEPGQELHSIFADPVLVSIVPGVNFQLANASSPAINAGDPNTVIVAGELDAYGDMRIVGDTIDIGADEYSGVLPVTFLEPFAASVMEGGVRLTWRTATEILNDRFVVERSPDLVQWETVGKLPAQGTSAKYEMMDKSAISGLVYYRLVQVDLDGTQTYSAIEQVFIKESNQITAYPNPAKDVVYLSGINQPVTSVLVSDLQGKTLRVWSGVDKNKPLDLGDLASGIYLLRIIDRNFTETLKIIKD